MNTEIAKEWAERLRSGKYKQGSQQLRRHDEFCCLGVLCDMAAEAGIGMWHGNVFDAREWHDTPPIASDNIDIETNYVPRRVREWADLFDRDPGIVTDDGRVKPSELNDHGKSFEEIAAVIEKHAQVLR